MKLKKRIIGFLLLAGIVLIIVPLFFGRSIPSDELKLSERVPTPPHPKTKSVPISIPERSATVPEIAQISPAATEVAADSSSSIVFEGLESDESVTPAAAPVANQANIPTMIPPATNNAPVVSEISTPQPVVPTEPSSEITQSTAMEAMPLPEPAVVSSLPVKPISKNVTPPITVKNSATKAKKTAKKSLTKQSQKPAQLPPSAEAWSVQLGSFSAKSNAQKLMKQLQAQGFTAYLRTTKTAKGDFVRVLVGPTLQRSDAAQLQTRIQKELNIQTILVKTEGV